MALQDFGSLSFSTPQTGAQEKMGSPRAGGKTTPLDSAVIDRIVAEEGADGVKPTVLGIYGQESGGGTNAVRSIDGALGGMQIIPATFNRFAKPGERIDNPEDNFRVGVRYLKSMGDRFGNDPARLAVGYFSGEGNINPSGDTPYKEDRKDGNGKTVSSYVRDLVGRVGGAAVPEAKAAEPAKKIDLSGVPTYSDFIAQPKWQDLNDEQRGRARAAYFDHYLAPQLPEARRTTQRDAFLARAQQYEADNKPPGMLDRIKGGLADAGTAVLGAFGQGEAAANDPAGIATVTAPAESKIGVMGTQAMPAAPGASRAPVTPEFRAELGRAFDAATPAQREQMQQADGVVGQLARERAGQFAAAPQVDIAKKFDTRAEARADRMRAEGVDPKVAENFGRYGAAAGQAPGSELGTMGASNFDFETQQRFNKDPVFSNPVIRAAVKGYQGYRQGSLGLAQALFDATGNQEFADIAKQGVADAQRTTTAMGEKGDGLQRNFEGAVSSIAQQLPALLAGVATGTEVLPLAAMFTQTFGQEYGSGRAQGLDGSQAAARAGIYGAFEVIGEKFGLGQTLQALKLAAKGAPTQDIATVLAQGMLREIPGEQLTTLGQFLTDKVPGIGTNLEAGLAQYLQQAGDTLAQTVMQGGLMMGGTTGVSAGVRHLQGDPTQASQDLAAEQAREQALNKSAAFFQPPARPKHASTAAAEQVVREMAAEAGIDPAELLPAEKPAPVVPVAAAQPTPTTPAPQAQPSAAPAEQGAQPAVTAESPDIAQMSDAILAAEAANGAPNAVASPVPPESVDSRGAAPDAGMATDPAAGRAGPVPGSDGRQAGTEAAGTPNADAVPGADGAADGQPALSHQPAGEPPIAPGMTRLYHGGEAGRYDGPAWYSTSRKYAEGYATKDGRTGAEVQYVDYPTEKVNALADPDGYGQTPAKGFDHQLELSSEETGPRKPLPVAEAARAAAPVAAALAEMSDDQLRERLAYMREQARANGGWNKMAAEERNRIDAELARRAAAAIPPAADPAQALDAAAHEAATSPANSLPEPTDAQKAAGNYRMGHATLHGLDITIENPRGSTRSGTDADGKAWSVEMANHYGYIKRTEGADGDHVDVFIGPKPESTKVFVVDQVDPRTGKYDEHKVLMGFSSLATARAGYLANYEQGWKGAGAITPMSMDEFKAWLKEGDTTKPLNPKVGKPKTEKQAKAAREAAKAGKVAPSDLPRERAGLAIARHEVRLVRKKLSGDVDYKQTLDNLPPVPEGHIRLFRGSADDVGFHDVFDKKGLEDHFSNLPGVSYTPNIKFADYYRASYGKSATIHYIDVPAEVAESLKIDAAEYKVDVDGLNSQGRAAREQAKPVAEAQAPDAAAPLPISPSSTPAAASPPAKPKPKTEKQLRAERADAAPVAKGVANKAAPAEDRPLFSRAPGTNTEAFKRWFGKSEIVDAAGKPRVMYHGTGADIASLQGKQAGAIFLTYAPSVAEGYAHTSTQWLADHGMEGAPNILPVYVKAENPFDYESAKHRTQLITAAIAGGKTYVMGDGRRAMLGEDGNGTLYTVGAIEAGLTTGANNWSLIEEPWFQDAIKRAGFDSFYVHEEGFKNLGVYEPSQVKSATGNIGAFDASNPDIRFRRGAPAGRLNAEDLRAQFAPIIKQWQNGPKGGIEVVQSVDDLPSHLAEALRSAGEDGRVEGFYLPKSDKVYLIADNLPSAERAQEVAFHEVYGHKGLRAILPAEQYASMMDRIRRANPKIAAAADDWFDAYGGDTIRMNRAAGQAPAEALRNAELLAVEEALADMAATVPVAGPVRKLLAALQAGLRKIGLHAVADWLEGKTEAETFKLLRDARAAVFGNGAQVAASSAAPVFARAQPGQPALPLQGGAGAGPRWQAPDPTRMDRLIYELQNRQIDLKRVQTAIRETVSHIPESFDAYQKEEAYHGRVAARTAQFLKGELRPLIEDLRLRKISMGELEAFLWARHARERNAQIASINPDYADGGSGLTDKQAADYFAGADVKDSAGEVIIKGMDKTKLADLKALAARVDRMNEGTQQVLIQYGLESPDTVKAWASTYKHYVPLKREDMDGVTPIGRGFSVRGSASKRAMGSRRKVADILANIALAREAAITRGEKNRVTLALYGLAVTNPNAEFWNTDKPPTIQKIHPTTGKVVKIPDPSHLSKDNVIVLRVRGEDRSISFNEHDPRAMRIASAMKNLDVAPFGEIMGAVAATTRYLAAINTQYNPVFGLLNAIRDVQGAALNLTTTPIADKRAFVLANAPAAMRAIWQVERYGNSASPWARLYDQLELAGGTTGYREIFRTGKDKAEALQKEIDSLDHSAPRKVLDYMINWLDHYNTAIENAIRLTAFKAALDKGLSEERAGSVAKNLTVNFNRKGRMGRELGSLYAFFNAAVQGTARMMETLDPRTRHGKAILIGGVMVGVIQALVAAAAMDDDDWDAIPEFTKQRNFIIPMGKSYAMIPMPLGFNVLPNIGRILTEAIKSGGAKWRKQLPDLLGVLLDNANPMGSGTFSQVLAPTVADPIIALAENKDFTGKPIFKEDQNPMRPKPGFQRAKDTASTVSKGIAYGTNWVSGGTNYTPGLVSPTPDQLDYLFGTITGGLGREVNKAYQSAELMAKGKDVPEYKKPIVGRFYGDFEGDADTAGRYWNVVREVNEKRNEFAGRAKDGNDAAGYLAEHPELGLVRRMDATQQALQKLRAAKAQVEMSPNLREPERTARMDEIDARSKKIMEEFTAQAKMMKGGKQ